MDYDSHSSAPQGSPAAATPAGQHPPGSPPARRSVARWLVVLIAVGLLGRFARGTDYFVAPRRELMANRSTGSWLLHIGKNLLGAVFVIVGIALLVLPGQGLLTIFIGLLMLEFPRKRAIELRIVRRPAILKLLNGMREKRGRAPFVIEPAGD